jgi:hemerythrin
MILKWDNTLATGVAKMDSQHKEVFNRMNQLIFAMREGKSRAEVIKTLDSLENYVIKHFNEEEEIQMKNNYPQYSVQHFEHEKFKKELKEVRNTFENTGISAIFVINTQQKITKWWRNHISDLDKDLGEFLLEKSK